MKYLTLVLLSVLGYCAFTQPSPYYQIQADQVQSTLDQDQSSIEIEKVPQKTEDYEPVSAENVRYAVFFEKKNEYQAFKQDYQEELTTSGKPCIINPQYPPPFMKNAKYCAFIPFSKEQEIEKNLKRLGFTFQIKSLKRLGENISKDHPG